MFIKKKNMLFIISFLLCVPLFGMDNTKKSVEKGAFKLETPTHFWRPEKVVNTSLGVGAAGLLLSGPGSAAIGSVVCFKLISHKTRKGCVLSAQAHIDKCDPKMLDVAQLAKKDKALFMNAIKEKYGLPNGLVKVHEQLVTDIKKLKMAAQLLEQSYMVNPENVLPHQLAKLKAKKQAVDSHIQSAEYAIAVLRSTESKL